LWWSKHQRRKHLFKKQFPWPVMFCKPFSPVFQILVFEQEHSALILEWCQPAVLRTRNGKRHKANCCFPLNLLNVLFHTCFCYLQLLFSKAPCITCGNTL
jgi:hypothetical protein